MFPELDLNCTQIDAAQHLTTARQEDLQIVIRPTGELFHRELSLDAYRSARALLPVSIKIGLENRPRSCARCMLRANAVLRIPGIYCKVSFGGGNIRTWGDGR